MEENIYIDVLFIVNLFVNYFLLLSTAKLMKSDKKRLRIILGAFLGSLYAVAVFFVTLPAIILILTKLVFAVSIVLVTFGKSPVINFVKTLCIFFSVNFLFAGLMLACWFFFAPKGMEVNNGIVYFNISPVFLALFSAISYGTIILLNKIFKKSLPPEIKMPVRVSFNGRETVFDAIIDTGNGLVEMFSGYEVIVCEYNAVKGILSKDLKEMFENIYNNTGSQIAINNFRIIPLDTVSGLGMLPAFKPDYVVINDQKISEVYIAACEKKISQGSYVGLINPSLVVL